MLCFWTEFGMSFAGGERGEILRLKHERRAGWRPCRGSELWGQGRSPEAHGTQRYRAPSRLSSLVPRRVFESTILAGGEDDGYFALGAGDAGSNPAAGIVPA